MDNKAKNEKEAAYMLSETSCIGLSYCEEPLTTFDQDETLTRKEAAEYLDFAVGSLASWDCTKRYNLFPKHIGRTIYYRRSVLEKLLQKHGGAPSYVHDPVMSRKKAAKYIGKAAGTLAVWDCTKEYDLQPIQIGSRAVRYRKSVLDRFLQERMTP